MTRPRPKSSPASRARGRRTDRDWHWVRRCSRGCPDNGPYYVPPDDSPCAWCEGKVKVVRCRGGRPVHTSRPARLSQKGFNRYSGYQEAFGQEVRSPQHFKHLQKRHGTVDADGTEYNQIPRGFK